MESIHPVDQYVGTKLRNRRKKCGLSQEALAKKLNASHQLIQKYEKGETRISASTLFEIAYLLTVKPSYFYEGLAFEDIYGQKEDKKTIDLREERILNILIVEDNISDELLTRKAIERSDIQNTIHTVKDGMSALEFLKKKELHRNTPLPHIILLDLNIPQKSGISLLQEVKRHPDLRHIPVVILTNSINREEMKSCYERYASGYICKDFDFSHFEENIKYMLLYWSKAVALV